MSRRSRRRRSNSSSAGWLGKAALALIVLGLLAAGVMYAMVRSYLHSDDFRRLLSAKASQAANVTGEFSPFRWEGLAVDTSRFEATGNDVIRDLRVEGLHTEVGLGGLRRGTWEILGSRVQRLDISLDARKPSFMPIPLPSQAINRQPAEKKGGWLPEKVEVQGLDIGDLLVRALLPQGEASASGLRVRAEANRNNHSWQAEAANGSIRLPFSLLPEIRLGRASLRYQDNQVFLTSATASAWKDGRLETSGEWNAITGEYSLQGDVTGVKCEDIFNEDWAKRFKGDVSSDFTLENLSGPTAARGHLSIRNGSVTALPMLDSLAAYADTRRFRMIALSEASTDWSWKKGEILFSNLILASEGLIRLEGRLSIRGNELDGTFRLGLAPGTLASIPGAETDVFSPGNKGLLWAPLHITGTLDDPHEDLTDRLVSAAGARMFDVIPETGEKVIKFTHSILGDNPSKTIEKGTKIVEKGTKLIEKGTKIVDDLGGVDGLLDGLLGSPKPPTPEPSPKPEANKK